MASITQRPDVPSYREKPLRIATVQFDPKIREVEANIAKVEEMLKDLQPGSVDLVVLPEMAFSGYMFSSPESIAPYLEEPRIGPTALFCRALAKRVCTYVIAGYPEQPSPALPEGRGYNSALLVSPGGDVIHNYRKTFLFETDQKWAVAGDGFSYIDLPQPLGRLSMAICMDINNGTDFLSPWDAYELATFVQKNSVDVLVLSANWLDPPSPPDAEPVPEMPEDEMPSEDTLNYWAHRLLPLHDPAPYFEEEDRPGKGVEGVSGNRQTVFVAANRVGTEEGSKFVGSSTAFLLTTEPSKVEVIDVLGRKEEMVLFVTLS
ncbi:carbon-nitrogen hydrolase [Mrakia frigida]|uniref:amidase n=1 Tax=Mrakia frigida TaxID=29902 RepID=UPI003FCBF785